MNTSYQSPPTPAKNFTNNYEPSQAPNQMNYYHQNKSNNGNFEQQSSNNGRLASLALFGLASIGLIVHVVGLAYISRDIYVQEIAVASLSAVVSTAEKWFHVVYYLLTNFVWLYTILIRSKNTIPLSLLLAGGFVFFCNDLKELSSVMESSANLKERGFYTAAQVAFSGGTVLALAWFGKIFTL